MVFFPAHFFVSMSTWTHMSLMNRLCDILFINFGCYWVFMSSCCIKLQGMFFFVVSRHQMLEYNAFQIITVFFIRSIPLFPIWHDNSFIRTRFFLRKSIRFFSQPTLTTTWASAITRKLWKTQWKGSVIACQPNAKQKGTVSIEELTNKWPIGIRIHMGARGEILFFILYETLVQPYLCAPRSNTTTSPLYLFDMKS